MHSTTLLLILSWLFYFFIHSLLASISVKDFVASKYPKAMPYYRLTFNILAVLFLALPLWAMQNWSGDWLWQWVGYWSWFAHTIALLAIVCFIWSLKYYDMSEFFGFRQLSNQVTSVDDQEQFHLSPFHRWVRHPWYFFALLFIWARDMNEAMLVSAIMMTLYFVIGSRYEDRKLIRYHGERYRRYIELVPGLIPLPWRYLSQAQMDELLSDDRNDR